MADKTDDKKRKCEQVNDKNDAVRNAIEAAKKIKAKLDEAAVSNDEKFLEPKETLIKDKETVIGDKADICTLEFTKSIDFSDSKYKGFICSTAFPSLLKERLQLGPTEHFSLKLTGTSLITLSASSEDILNLAEKELASVQDTGHFRSLKAPVKSTTVIKIPLGFEPLPAHISFLRGKLLGPQGSFLKHIQTTTRTRVQLRGKGSGYFEVTEPKDGIQEAMHLVVEGSDDESIKEAKQLCEDLIATARSEYDAKITLSAYPPINPIYLPSNYPQPFYQQLTPQQYYAMQQAYAQYYAQYHAQPQPPQPKDDLDKK